MGDEQVCTGHLLFVGLSVLAVHRQLKKTTVGRPHLTTKHATSALLGLAERRCEWAAKAVLLTTGTPVSALQAGAAAGAMDLGARQPRPVFSLAAIDGRPCARVRQPSRGRGA